jgi:hypothetical protein
MNIDLSMLDGLFAFLEGPISEGSNITWIRLVIVFLLLYLAWRVFS